MKLRFRNSASFELESFVNRYRDVFLAIYSNTGLWNESLIVADYERGAVRLYHAVKDAISARLTRRRIIGRKAIKRGWHEIAFHVDARLIIVHYSEDKNNKIRWIEYISVDRKPIIF